MSAGKMDSRWGTRIDVRAGTSGETGGTGRELVAFTCFVSGEDEYNKPIGP